MDNINLTNRNKLNNAKKAYPGWPNLIEEADRMMKFVDSEYKIDQIKEKFGGLRYYYHPSETYAKKMAIAGFKPLLDPLNVFVRFIERLSFLTCEECGITDPDSVKSETTEPKSFWIKTLCESCREKRYKDR